jgi:ATP-dependent Clp protease adaptor protein ClpS
MSHYWPEDEGGVATEKETREKIDKPRMYKVLLHNDNYTTMEFVVLVLMSIFLKPESEAVQIMLDVHRKGIGVAGVYQREIAETKVERAMQMARQAQFPFLVTMEPE